MAESLWAVISVNIAFISTLFGAIVSIVLSFGLDILNAIISMIVFFTMLYYLLASSNNSYKPIVGVASVSLTHTQEFLSRFDPNTARSPVSSPQQTVDTSKSVTHAFEQAVSGVFLLSIKMSAFYGLYTWFIHALFGLNIVFIPSGINSQSQSVTSLFFSRCLSSRGRAAHRSVLGERRGRS